MWIPILSCLVLAASDAPDTVAETQPATIRETDGQAANLFDLTSNDATRTLAVLDVQVSVEDLETVVGESLSAVLAAEIQLRVGRKTKVLARNEIRALLDQAAAEQMVGCADTRCYSDVGKLVAADLLVTSSLAKLENEYLFTMQLIDVKLGTVLRRQSVPFYGAADQLVDLIPPYTSLLIEGPPAEAYKGSVRVVSSEEQASIALDNTDLGLSPVSQVDQLPIGRHRLRVAKDGYLTVEQDVVVRRDQTTLFQAQLIDEDSLKPWYSRWYVWGGAAAIVGGIVAVAIIASGDDDPTTVEISTPLP